MSNVCVHAGEKTDGRAGDSILQTIFTTTKQYQVHTKEHVNCRDSRATRAMYIFCSISDLRNVAVLSFVCCTLNNLYTSRFAFHLVSSLVFAGSCVIAESFFAECRMWN